MKHLISFSEDEIIELVKQELVKKSYKLIGEVKIEKDWGDDLSPSFEIRAEVMEDTDKFQNKE